VTTIDPLLRRALGFARRGPGWSLAVTLAVAAFAAARATAPLVADAAADRSFAAEAAVAAESPNAKQGLDARAYTTGLADLSASEAVSGLLDDLPVFGPPIVTVSPLLPYTDSEFPDPVIKTADGRQSTAIVFSIGNATESLQPAASTTSIDAGGPGIWVPDTVAAELNIAPGVRVEVGLDYPDADVGRQPMVTAATTVLGIYSTENGVPGSSAFDWQSIPVPLPDDPGGGGGGARLLLTDTATAMSLMAQMGDTSFVRWDAAWTGPVSIEQGRDAAVALNDATRQLVNHESLVGRQVSAGSGQPVTLSSGVPSFLRRSEQAAAELQPLVSAIAFTAQVMSVMVLAICIWLLTRSRRREQALSLSMGTHPLRLGVVAAIEQLIPILVGVGAAFVVVRWYPALVAGEGSIDRGTIDASARSVLWALPLAALVVIVSGFGAAWPLDSSSAGRGKRVVGAINGETVVVVGAIATGAQLLTQRGSTLDSGTSMLFPLLAVLAGSVIVVRVAAVVIRSISAVRTRRAAPPRTQRPRSLAVWLARRRVAFSLRELSALVIVVAAGVGLFAYCWSVSADGRQGVSDKEAAAGGAFATAAITSADQLPLGADHFPVLPPGRTVVWTVSDSLVAPNVSSDVLAVDPLSFPAAAAWRDSFADESLSSLLDEMSAADPFTLDVVVAGNYTDTFPDNGTMDLDQRAGVHYRVVARIAAVPWQRERSSMMLVSARALAAVLPAENGKIPVPVTTIELDRIFRTYVWSNGSQADLEASLGTALRGSEAPNVPEAERLPAFVAFGLSLPYVRLVGIALLTVSLAAIIVLGARRRVDLAIELAMTDRMGMSRRTMAAAVAGGAVLLGVFSSLIGIGIARLVIGFMLHRIDPRPSLAPKFSGGLSTTAIAVALLSVAAVSIAGAVMELSGARHARVAEVLRGAE
jgi:hypothetical protein